MKHLLWVDDCRNPYEADWLDVSPIALPFDVYWAKSYDDAIGYLEQQWPDAVCLDHDLGGEKTGYDIAKHIVGRCMDEGLPLPAYASQSDNPAGRENILYLLDNYLCFSVSRRNGRWPARLLGNCRLRNLFYRNNNIKK